MSHGSVADARPTYTKRMVGPDTSVITSLYTTSYTTVTRAMFPGTPESRERAVRGLRRRRAARGRCSRTSRPHLVTQATQPPRPPRSTTTRLVPCWSEELDRPPVGVARHSSRPMAANTTMPVLMIDPVTPRGNVIASSQMTQEPRWIIEVTSPIRHHLQVIVSPPDKPLGGQLEHLCCAGCDRRARAPRLTWAQPEFGPYSIHRLSA